MSRWSSRQELDKVIEELYSDTPVRNLTSAQWYRIVAELRSRRDKEEKENKEND